MSRNTLLDGGAVAILGMLSLRAMSGYEIRQAYQQGMVHFWNISFGQIYPLLKRLETKKMIRPSGNRGGRERQRFEITAVGRKGLQEWIAAAPANPPARNELLLKIFFATPDMAPQILEHLERFSRTQEALQQQYSEVAKWLAREHAEHPSLPFWQTTLAYGQRQSKALQEWADESVSSLTKKGKKQ